MKKGILAILSVMAIGTSAAANCNDFCMSSGIVSAELSGISALILAPFVGTSQALGNDIIGVQEDAIIALETGVGSVELLSVIQKIRAELPEMVDKSDVEIVSMMVNN